MTPRNSRGRAAPSCAATPCSRSSSRSTRRGSPYDAPTLDPFPALVRDDHRAADLDESRRDDPRPAGRAACRRGDAGALLALTDEQFRQAGLSRQKIGYSARPRGRRSKSGDLPVASLHELDDDAVIDAIVKVKGLGRWSAEMFLMFRLRRPGRAPGRRSRDRHRDPAALWPAEEAQRRRGSVKIGEAWRPLTARSRAGICGAVSKTNLTSTR